LDYAFIQFLGSRMKAMEKGLRFANAMMFLIPSLSIWYWWMYSGIPTSDTFVGRIVVTALPIFPVAIVFAHAKLVTARIQRDLKLDEMVKVEGRASRCLARGGSSTTRHSRHFEQSIRVDGRKVKVPLEVYEEVEDGEEISVEVFPNTGLCWTMNGERIW
jgi:hypothetical protein